MEVFNKLPQVRFAQIGFRWPAKPTVGVANSGKTETGRPATSHRLHPFASSFRDSSVLGTCAVGGSDVLLFCMRKPFSVRAWPSEIAAIDSRAAKLGQDRTKYILSLVRRDLVEGQAPRKHRFASEDLIGSIRTGLKTGNNATIRRLARQRLLAKNR